jgi:hypothetical protein
MKTYQTQFVLNTTRDLNILVISMFSSRRYENLESFSNEELWALVALVIFKSDRELLSFQHQLVSFFYQSEMIDGCSINDYLISNSQAYSKNRNRYYRTLLEFDNTSCGARHHRGIPTTLVFKLRRCGW